MNALIRLTPRFGASLEILIGMDFRTAMLTVQLLPYFYSNNFPRAFIFYKRAYGMFHVSRVGLKLGFIYFGSLKLPCGLCPQPPS